MAVTPGDEPLKKSPPKSGYGAGNGVMTPFGPVFEGPHCLLTHKDYAIEEVESFIKPTDIDLYAQLGTEDLGESAIFYLTQALVHVKVLQNRCVAKKGVVTRVKKHNVNLLNQQGQYKEAVRLLNVDLKECKEKLEKAGRQKEKLEQKLTALREQVKQAGANVVKKFKASDSFIDTCGGYYDIGFDDCLKQVVSAFLELDLSGITIDDAPPATPTNDIVVVEGDDLEDASPPDDSDVILAQPTANPPVTAPNPSVEDLGVEDPPKKSKKSSSDASSAQP